jgi:hypothetical protein
MLLLGTSVKVPPIELATEEVEEGAGDGVEDGERVEGVGTDA